MYTQNEDKIWKAASHDMMAKIKKKKQAYKRHLQTHDGTDYLFYTS